MGNLVRSADPKFLILLVLLGLSNLGVYEFYAPAACEECEQLKEQPISFDRGQLYLNLGKEIEEFRATYGGEGDATWSVVMKPFTQLIETVDGPNPGKGGFTNFKLTSQEAFSAEIKLGQMITSRRLRTSMVVGATSDEGKLAKRSMPIEVTDPYICTFGDARFGTTTKVRVEVVTYAEDPREWTFRFEDLGSEGLVSDVRFVRTGPEEVLAIITAGDPSLFENCRSRFPGLGGGCRAIVRWTATSGKSKVVREERLSILRK